jgi:hypothetical protein
MVEILFLAETWPYAVTDVGQVSQDLTTLDLVKGWLGVALSDTTRDTILASLITAASEQAILEMARSPILQPYAESVNGTGGSSLPVNAFPIVSVTSVTIAPETGAPSIPGSQIFFDDNLVYWRMGRFPLGPRNVRVVYSAGLVTIPASITLAMQYTCKP